MHVLSMPAVDATEADLLDQGLLGFVKHNAWTENVTRVHSIDQEIDAYMCSLDTSTSLAYCCSIHIWSRHCWSWAAKRCCCWQTLYLGSSSCRRGKHFL